MTYTTDLNGLYKPTFSKYINNLVPECALIYKDTSFSDPSETLGAYFIQPVILSPEQGFSFAAADDPTFTANGAISMKMGQAQVTGYQLGGQASITVEAVKRALSKGPSAFDSSIGLQMKSLKLSAIKRLELLFLYGQSGLATVATRTNVNATTTTAVITLSQWAAGIWAGMTNAKFDVYQAGTYGSQTRVGTGSFTVTAIDTNTRTLTLSAAAGDITAFDTYVGANANQAQLFFQNSYNKEPAGLKRQMTNTGTLFNIDAATNDLWRGNTYSLTTPFALTFKELQKAVAVAVTRGLDRDVNVYVSINTWANLNSDQAALRQYTGQGSQNSEQYENGAQRLVYQSQNGLMTVIPHLFVKEGDAFIVNTDDLKRIGACDVTFDLPGTAGGDVFIQGPNAFSVEYRLYSNQTLFLETPSQAVYLQNIVN
jgi:hypothetical protein